jgi:hypothetical protein
MLFHKAKSLPPTATYRRQYKMTVFVGTEALAKLRMQIQSHKHKPSAVLLCSTGHHVRCREEIMVNIT